MRRLSAAIFAALFPVGVECWSPTFIASREAPRRADVSLHFATENIPTETHNTNEDSTVALSQHIISKLRFRELHYELSRRDLPTHGTTGQLRERLRQAALPDEAPECIVNEDGIEDDCLPEVAIDGLTFVDESDPDFESKDLIRQVEEKAELGHWKTATRKLKRLTRHYENIPESVYLAALEACSANRLQGARASEPARKIMEQMIEQGMEVPEKLGNYCIQNSLGHEMSSTTHQGFGGLDTALAMKAAMEHVGTPLNFDTSLKIAKSHAKEGNTKQSLEDIQRLLETEHVELETFAELAEISVSNKNDGSIVEILTLCKAAGYELNDIARMPAGRSLLATGVVAAERMGNDALAFRLLTAASQVNVEEGRGDELVAHQFSQSERASTLIHKRAVINAVEDGQWQLAVKVLELMLERKLRPSKWIWRNVVACCAKKEKSKKATAVLMDWVRLYEQGKADQPPLSAFNSCVNVCEICSEEELTLLVLDEMKRTHDTDGNIITFNIALKRLAKQGNYQACEGIIVGMLQAEVEPTVVSYTTAIAACITGDSKHSQIAYEWLQRMRSRRVQPNVRTYNSALASCLDGSLESTMLASKIAKEMLLDVDRQLDLHEDTSSKDAFDVQHTVLPDLSTRNTARQLLAQLKQLWMEEKAIDKDLAEETVAVSLQKLIDFESSESAARAKDQSNRRSVDKDQARSTTENELELEYSTHRTAEV